MIYESLVNQLRKAAEPAIDFPDTLYDEAADAIYKLRRENKNWEKAMKTALDFIPQWIPVTERLPEEWKSVLTYQPYKNDREKPLIRISWYIGAGIWRECEQANTLELPVTHWMPLPEPPKEEEND